MVETVTQDSIRFDKFPIPASKVLEDYPYEQASIVGVVNNNPGKGIEVCFIVELHDGKQTTEIELPADELELCRYEEELNNLR